MNKKYTRVISMYVLALIMILTLNSCIFVWNQNFGSDIYTNKTVDDMALEQDYQAEITGNKRRWNI